MKFGQYRLFDGGDRNELAPIIARGTTEVEQEPSNIGGTQERVTGSQDAVTRFVRIARETDG